MKKMLIAFILLLSITVAFCQKVQQDKSLVAYFPFDGNSNDLSSCKLNAKNYYAALTADPTGKPNSAYYFNGVNAYIEVQSSPAINLTDEFTISCWIAPESKSNYSSWISKSLPNTQWRFGFGDPRFNDWGFGNWNIDRADYLTTADSIPLKQWSFVAATYSKTTKAITLYLNGKLVESFEIAYDFNGSKLPLFIGYQSDDVCWFNGNIDELKLFNRALNLDEICNLYKEFAGKITQPAFVKRSQTYTSQNGLKNYFNQLEPGIIPISFAPEMFCTNKAENSSPSFSPDMNEVYWSLMSRSHDTIYQEIVFSKKVADKWTDPKRVSFSTGKMYEGGPVLSADGNELYIYRGQPVYMWGRVPRNSQIVCYTRVNGEWSNPQIIADGAYPTVTIEGTIYYNSRSLQAIRMSQKDGKYSRPDTIKQIKFPTGRNYQFQIAPDESYLIFTNTYESGDNGDFYITFYDKETNNWTEPKQIEAIRTTNAEYSPRLSPDGKYFFFVSPVSWVDEDIFWIKSSFIDEIKKEILK